MVSNDVILFNVLKDLCVPCGLKGYRCITEAVNILLEHGRIKLTGDNGLYDIIRKRTNDNSVECVERNIRHAVKATLCQKTNRTALYKYLGISADTHKITNIDFIYGLYEYVKANEK